MHQKDSPTHRLAAHPAAQHAMPGGHRHDSMLAALTIGGRDLHFWRQYFPLPHAEKDVLHALQGASSPQTVQQLASAMGLSPEETQERITRLARHKMLHQDASGTLHLDDTASQGLHHASQDDSDFETLGSQVRRKTFLYFGYDSISYLLNYLVTILIARNMGLEGFGLFSIALAISSLLAAVTPLGLPLEMQRFLPMFVKGGEWGSFKGMIQCAFRVTLTASSLAVLLGVVALLLANLPPKDTALLAISLLLIPINAVDKVVCSCLEAQKKFQALFSFNMFLSPLFYLLAILGLSHVVPLFTNTHLMITVVSIHLIIMLVKLTYFLRKLPPEWKDATPVHKTKEWIKGALPMLWLTISILIVYYCDVLIVSLVAGKGMAGIYSAALSTTALLAIFQQGTNTVTSPEIAPLFMKGKMAQLQRLMTLVAKLSFWPALVAFVLVSIYAHDIMHFFGQDFHGQTTYWIIMLLMVVNLVKAASGEPGYLLLLSGKGQIVTRIYAVVTPLFVVAAVGLTWAFGVVGMAMASVLMMFGARIWLTKAVYSHMRINGTAFGGRFRPLLQEEEGQPTS